MNKLISLILASSIFVSACSTTVINSEPSGAMLYINGEKVGVTPYTYTDKKIIGTSNAVLLKKDGYQDFLSSFSRSENVSVMGIIGTVLFILPVLWIMDYKPSHSYELVPQNISANK